jgi:prolyl-tRNA synthetase
VIVGTAGCCSCRRGDHRVNDIKLRTRSARVPPAREEEFADASAPPATSARSARRADPARRRVEPGAYVTGANRESAPARRRARPRLPVQRGDVRTSRPGHGQRPPDPDRAAIEVGNIFKLGTRFSEPLGATYLDESGNEQLIWMGSYGSARRASAPPPSSSSPTSRASRGRARSRPTTCTSSGSASPGRRSTRWPKRLYGELREAGLDVIYDDREDLGPGGKFADAELLGCPLRLTAGKRSLASGELEARSGAARSHGTLPLEGAAERRQSSGGPWP